ncbi:MAG: DUF456 domain-containing protein [Candidatus Berkelbacteria bacterium]|nr:DUF456 domain-containing protein [Candidatus Berkelbacteria bacterium]
MPYFVLVIIFTILLLPGIIGAILPIIPSIPWMFVVALIFGIIDRFQHLRWWELLILGILALISITADNVSGLVGAKGTGASRWGILGGFIGGLIGLFFFPPWGAIMGMILGVVILEIIYNRDNKKAVKSASGVILGNLANIVINLILCFIFIGLFLLFVLK